MSNTIKDAWNKFVKDNPNTFDPAGLHATQSMAPYLANRLDRAFKAGMLAGAESERKRITERIQTILAP